MSNVHICRQHDLSVDECRAVAEELLGKLTSRFGGSVNEGGADLFLYRHPAGVKGKVEVKAGEITVNVKLGLMTRSLAAKMDKEINKVLDEHIG